MDKSKQTGRGYFITVEGGEGAGKSSMIDRMADDLRKQGQTVIVTREPGGIPIAEQIRAVIHDTANTAMDGRTEALLYAAARRQHLVEKVIPALNEGITVISDRFIDSSLAYQGYARGIGVEEVFEMNRFAIDDCMPDLTIYMDVDPAIGLSRIRSDEAREINRLDLEAEQFHQQVRAAYLQLADRFKDRIVTVDANPAPEQVYLQIKEILEKLYKRKVQ